MIEVYPRLNVGDEMSCRAGSPELAVVHACKSPCHQRAVGYHGNLPALHQHYLSLERRDDLFLNLIDPPKPLFRLESFDCFLAFAAARYDSGSALLIHCNQGESRAPSLALLFLAKRLRTIPAESFWKAKEAFARLYPAYRPGTGIRQFFADHWAEIL